MRSNVVCMLVGICCAVFIFVFVLLPRIDQVQASNVPTLKFHEVENMQCPGPCHTRVSCEDDCEEGDKCCAAGTGETGSCLEYC